MRAPEDLPLSATAVTLDVLCAPYDGFLLDLWGVVMDGQCAFPGALAWLVRRRREGRPVWFLSNASRPTAEMVRLLDGLGIAPDLYAGITTSGQMTIDALQAPAGPYVTGAILVAGETTTLAGWPDAVFARLVTEPSAAALILAMGSFAPEELEARLAPLHGLLDRPLLCANPDREVVFGGRRLFGAGMLAQRFAELGGRIREFGKPDPAVFHDGAAQLQALGAERVLFVGDSMLTDIPGARAAGLDSLLLTSTGIHTAALGAAFGEPADPVRLAAFLDTWPLHPQHIAPALD